MIKVVAALIEKENNSLLDKHYFSSSNVFRKLKFPVIITKFNWHFDGKI